MPRWTLVAVLAAGVVCATIGVGLILRTASPWPAPYGWTAYSPLSSTSYSPGDSTAPFWTRVMGAALLAIGAGGSGAVTTLLLLSRRRSQ